MCAMYAMYASAVAARCPLPVIMGIVDGRTDGQQQRMQTHHAHECASAGALAHGAHREAEVIT